MGNMPGSVRLFRIMQRHCADIQAGAETQIGGRTGIPITPSRVSG